LRKWTERQIDLFAKKDLPLHQLRIKNPGQAQVTRSLTKRTTLEKARRSVLQPVQGKDWTADAIWAHVETMIGVFKERGLPPPIVNIHNHDTRQPAAGNRVLPGLLCFALLLP
jgi:hypothetical protein